MNLAIEYFERAAGAKSYSSPVTTSMPCFPRLRAAARALQARPYVRMTLMLVLLELCSGLHTRLRFRRSASSTGGRANAMPNPSEGAYGQNKCDSPYFRLL